MTAAEKLFILRELMKDKGVSHLLVVSEDYHQSEYVGDFFKSRAYISGFTGSAGTLIVSQNDAKLFTDGRYYLQAERQLAGSGIDLMRLGCEGVPSVSDYLVTNLKSGDTLAFDGKCVSASFCESLRKKLNDGVKFISDIDFPGLIWKDRPELPSSEIWNLDIKYCGKSHREKLEELRKKIINEGCDTLVMSSLCDIAWLYNLRASDVANTPVFLSYCIISKDQDLLYANPVAAKNVAETLRGEGVTLCDYSSFYDDLSKLSGKTVLVDKTAVSEAMIRSLDKCTIVDKPNPTLLMKSKKNPVELENLRLCHIADGLAVTKLMFELKFGTREFDELSVEQYLLSLRRECAGQLGVSFIGESFGTIAAFGPNAAMMHYSAKPESFAKIDKNAPVPMLLVDSGGQYLEGTTDITRTFVLGEISPEIKMHYTLTACGMLRLMNLVFLEGASGSSLDIICRGPLWEHGIDYRCGTGHGVGYLLSVHEGPNRFHWKTGNAQLEEGMVTSNEPGVYMDGSHGIRIENEIVTVKADRNEYGQFMRFDNITFCPIDLDGIDRAYMDESDVRKLNAYHKSVYDKLSPYLSEADNRLLAILTREIH
jgi:Xaa-Pro aminopeptidase